MSERRFLSLLIINSSWNEKIHLFGYPLCAKEDCSKAMGLIYMSVRETLGLKTIKNGRWTHEVAQYNIYLRHLIHTFSLFFNILFLFNFALLHDSHGSHPGSYDFAWLAGSHIRQTLHIRKELLNL